MVLICWAGYVDKFCKGQQAHSGIWIFGPDEYDDGRKWIIDGRDSGVPILTRYLIRFRWGADRMFISWEEQVQAVNVHTAPYDHVYSVAGSWTSWKLSDMSREEADDGVWTTCLRIGVTGQEEFQFVRDRDWQQVVYPAKPKTTQTSVPVRGPDDMGHGKNWVVQGSPGDVLKLSFKIVDAVVTVSVHGDFGKKEWRSEQGWNRHQYFVAGSFTDWKCVLMEMDQKRPGVFTCRGTLPLTLNGPRGFEARFRILVDEDFNFAYHPMIGGARSGQSIAEGPDAKSREDNWLISSPFAAGEVFEISFDLTAIDRRQTVTWKLLPAAERLDD